ncbi:MAG: YggT family protein [Candidatus Mycalebacterium zealandia]|nr:MAG: YggT family protein [Candidatus Mycalebacterium zealandia]
MMLAQNTVIAIAEVVSLILTVYTWLIVARAVISWVDPNPYNPIVGFLYSVTEPVLERVRRVIPFIGGMDFSPIIVLLLLFFLRRVIAQTLYGIAQGL